MLSDEIELEELCLVEFITGIVDVAPGERYRIRLLKWYGRACTRVEESVSQRRS